MANISDGSGSKIFDAGRVGSNFCCLGQVGSAIFGLGMDLENFPQKCQIFQFFALRLKKMSLGQVEKYPGWPLIYCWSKVCSGRIRAHL